MDPTTGQSLSREDLSSGWSPATGADWWMSGDACRWAACICRLPRRPHHCPHAAPNLKEVPLSTRLATPDRRCWARYSHPRRGVSGGTVAWPCAELGNASSGKR